MSILKASAWIPRQLEKSVSTRISIDNTELQITLSEPIKSQKNIYGCRITVTESTDEDLSDEELIKRAEDWLVRATSRTLTAIYFLGSNIKKRGLHHLQLLDFEDFSSTWNSRELTVKTQQKLLPTPKIKNTKVTNESITQYYKYLEKEPFKDSRGLWMDAVSSFYEERYRESIIFAHAFLETIWTAAASAAIENRCGGASPEIKRILNYFEKEKIKNEFSMPLRLKDVSKILFGFSFDEKWGPDDLGWDRVTELNKHRNRVSHGVSATTSDEAWRGLEAAWWAFKKLRHLVDG